jgi:ABC-type transport system involved in multi-copper enzyme maturation permease subunit
MSVLSEDARASRPGSLRDLTGSEWIKFRSSRVTPVVLLAGIAVAAYTAYHDARGIASGWAASSAGWKSTYDPGSTALRTYAFGLLMVGAAVIGAMTVGGEQASGSLRTTFLATPARGRVIAAKAVVVSAVLAVAGAVAAVVAWAVTLSQFSGKVPGYSFGTPGVAQAIAATAVVLPVCGLIGIAVCVVVRNITATVLVLCALFSDYLLTTGPAVPEGGSLLGNPATAAPWAGWTRLASLNTDSTVLSVPRSWLTMLAWAALAMLVATVVQRRRDV